MKITEKIKEKKGIKRNTTLQRDFDEFKKNNMLNDLLISKY
jgi:hypothetical protein